MNNQDNEKVFQKSNINWFPGHMAKTRREIKERLYLIDVVYEVIDARMPISSMVADIDEIVENKPRILIVTKLDLCDKEETNKILQKFEDEGRKVVPIDLITGNTNKIIEMTNEAMKVVNDKRIEKGLKPRPARVLIIGIPNVGKSTLINRLVGRKAAGVANTPGHTKFLSWIRINKDVELLDTPGILWPKLEDQEAAHTLAAFTSIKEEILNVDDIASYILRKLYELYPDRLKERYDIEELDEDLIEAYETIGRKRGCLSKGGIVDYERVSSIILNDFKTGAFGKITLDRLK